MKILLLVVLGSLMEAKGDSGDLEDRARFPKSCSDIDPQSHSSSSIHRIYPDGRGASGFQVLCDFRTGGGGWTIIQKRSYGPKEEFYRNWTDYEQGFGSLHKNFWMGLKTIHTLTKNQDQELRIDLCDFEGNHTYAKYSNFSVLDSNFYQLKISGFSGTARDKLANGKNFTTKDKDNDLNAGLNCAEYCRGAWWYADCTGSNLNGFYYQKGEKPNPQYSNIHWSDWDDGYPSLRQVEMKIRDRRQSSPSSVSEEMGTCSRGATSSEPWIEKWASILSIIATFGAKTLFKKFGF